MITRLYKNKEHAEVEFNIQEKNYIRINLLGGCQVAPDGNTTSNSQVSKFSGMNSTYSLPENVVLLTLQELEDGNVLLRLAHLYEVLALFFT
ncbi:hypothetical protein R6Q59_035917 [Mikania micrantha]